MRTREKVCRKSNLLSTTVAARRITHLGSFVTQAHGPLLSLASAKIDDLRMNRGDNAAKVWYDACTAGGHVVKAQMTALAGLEASSLLACEEF